MRDIRRCPLAHHGLVLDVIKGQPAVARVLLASAAADARRHTAAIALQHGMTQGGGDGIASHPAGTFAGSGAAPAAPSGSSSGTSVPWPAMASMRRSMLASDIGRSSFGMPIRVAYSSAAL